MPVVFCKPDALSGPYAWMMGDRAVAFLRSLAACCDGDHQSLRKIPTPWRAAVEHAARQVRERAETEPSFRGEIVAPKRCGELLSRATEKFMTGGSTRELLRASLAGLGFKVIVEATHVCRVEDVDGVYASTTTTAAYADVRWDLVDYLADNEILVWWLSGDQDERILQWWKTYARHLLLDRRRGEYLLRNLVHVCEGSDAEYLSRLLGR